VIIFPQKWDVPFRFRAKKQRNFVCLSEFFLGERVFGDIAWLFCRFSVIALSRFLFGSDFSLVDWDETGRNQTIFTFTFQILHVIEVQFSIFTV